MSPLLTIVTVTKNCDATLEQTLLSVKAIKDSTIEYLIIDGVSTDGTLDLVKRYGALVDGIISEADTGIYNAMNKGVGYAKGKYILFINGDDELVSEGFPAVLSALQSGAGEIICATTLVGSLSTPSETLIGVPWRLPFFNSIPHPSSFVATSLMRRYPFREDLKIASDYDFFLQAFLGRHQFKIIPAITALHQRGGASGDSQRSLVEISQVRRDQLGWRYPIVTSLNQFYRLLKPLVQYVRNR